MANLRYLQIRRHTRWSVHCDRLIACVLMTVLVLLSACASTLENPPKALQPKLGSIGVQVQPFNPEVRLRRDRMNLVEEAGQIAVETVGGAGVGAVAGPLVGTITAVYLSHGLLPKKCRGMVLFIPVTAGKGCTTAWLGLFVLVEPASLMIGTAASFGAGVTYGVREAQARHGVEHKLGMPVEQKILQEIRRLNIEPTMHQQLVQAVQRRHSDKVVPLESGTPPLPVSTLLTTRILGMRIDGEYNRYRLNMTVEVKLIRQSDGTILYARTFDHVGKERRYDRYPLISEVGNFSRDLADEIASGMFQ